MILLLKKLSIPNTILFKFSYVQFVSTYYHYNTGNENWQHEKRNEAKLITKLRQILLSSTFVPQCLFIFFFHIRTSPICTLNKRNENLKLASNESKSLFSTASAHGFPYLFAFFHVRRSMNRSPPPVLLLPRTSTAAHHHGRSFLSLSPR